MQNRYHLREFFELTHVRQLQEASWALSGVIPELTARLFLLACAVFAHSTYHFTRAPATKSAANPFFAYPNRPLRADLDKIGVPPLGELWESFWSPRRRDSQVTPKEPQVTPRDPTGSIRKAQEALRKPQQASGNLKNPSGSFRKPQEASGTHRKPQETSGNHRKLSGSLGKPQESKTYIPTIYRE